MVSMESEEDGYCGELMKFDYPFIYTLNSLMFVTLGSQASLYQFLIPLHRRGARAIGINLNKYIERCY